MRLRQDTPAHVEQLLLASWNPSLHKLSLAKPRAFQTPWGRPEMASERAQHLGPSWIWRGVEKKRGTSTPLYLVKSCFEGPRI